MVLINLVSNYNLYTLPFSFALSLLFFINLTMSIKIRYISVTDSFVFVGESDIFQPKRNYEMASQSRNWGTGAARAFLICYIYIFSVTCN